MAISGWRLHKTRMMHEGRNGWDWQHAVHSMAVVGEFPLQYFLLLRAETRLVLTLQYNTVLWQQTESGQSGKGQKNGKFELTVLQGPLSPCNSSSWGNWGQQYRYPMWSLLVGEALMIPCVGRQHGGIWYGAMVCALWWDDYWREEPIGINLAGRKWSSLEEMQAAGKWEFLKFSNEKLTAILLVVMGNGYGLGAIRQHERGGKWQIAIKTAWDKGIDWDWYRQWRKVFKTPHCCCTGAEREGQVSDNGKGVGESGKRFK